MRVRKKHCSNLGTFIDCDSRGKSHNCLELLEKVYTIDGLTLHHLKFYGYNLYFYAVLSSISNFNIYSIQMQVLGLWFSSKRKYSSNISRFLLDLSSPRYCLFVSFLSCFVKTLVLWWQNIPYLKICFSLSTVLLLLSHAGTRFSAVFLTEQVTWKSFKTTWIPRDPASVAWTVVLEKSHVASQIPNHATWGSAYLQHLPLISHPLSPSDSQVRYLPFYPNNP